MGKGRAGESGVPFRKKPAPKRSKEGPGVMVARPIEEMPPGLTLFSILFFL